MRDWLAHRSTSTPDAEALVAAASGTTWSYEELDEAAAAMAGSLAALGLESGDHLGVFLTPRIEYVTLVHAAMRLGVRLVPVSDRLTETELQPRLERADVTAVLCAEATEQRTVEAVAEDDEDGPSVPVVSLDEPQWERVTYLKSVDPVEVDAHDWDPTEPLVYLFTSGSTGEPKLVELRVRNVRHSATTLLFRLGVDPGDRYLLTLPLHHTGGLMPLYRAVLAGTSVVLRTAFDPGGAADDIRTYDVTGVSLVPTMLKRMLDARGTLADSLRVVLLGGAPAPDKLIERCRDYSVPVHPTYGMTEAASAITVASPTEASENLGTVGRQLLWTELTVRGEDGERLQPGEVGELVVDGPSVTPGYYDAPEATEAAFGPHGFRTGDVGYRTEDGYVYVLNRKDDRIVTGGENVDPGEVVATLRDHPHVEDAAVVGVPDEEWGERVASLVVRDDDSMTPADLEAFCRERLADFKIPKTIRFTDALPRTDSGSVRRPDVRERIAAAEEAAIGDADTAVEAVPEEPPAEETAAEDDSEVEPPDEESPTEETSAEETPAEETPTEGTAAEETPAEETAAEETPAEETAPEETLAEETDPEETPTEETAAEETPAEDPLEVAAEADTGGSESPASAEMDSDTTGEESDAAIGEPDTTVGESDAGVPTGTTTAESPTAGTGASAETDTEAPAETDTEAPAETDTGSSDGVTAEESQEAETVSEALVAEAEPERSESTASGEPAETISNEEPSESAEQSDGDDPDTAPELLEVTADSNGDDPADLGFDDEEADSEDTESDDSESDFADSEPDLVGTSETETEESRQNSGEDGS